MNQNRVGGRPNDADLSGTMVGRIRLKSRLGVGGMGEVYVGVDETLGRQVAVKVLKGGNRALATQKARFLREAKTLSQLDHPNICKILDYVATDDQRFLILEYVAGTRLDQVIQKGLSEADKHRLAAQITGALVAAHSRNIIHRDLKPENVMVTPSGDAKVLDFGLARWVHDTRSERVVESESDASPAHATQDSLTVEGVVLGTPMYLSPEQAMGQPLTTQSDMYGLGLLLQELFTGRAAADKNLNLQEMLRQAAQAETRPVEGIDKDVAELIEALKSLAPAERPTARVTADRLHWIRDRPKRRRRKWVRLGLTAVLAVATLVSLLGFASARRAAAAARAAQDKAEAVSGFLQTMLTSADPWALGLDVKVRDVLDFAAAHVDEDFGDHPLHKAAVLHALGDTFMKLGYLHKAQGFLESARRIRLERLGSDHPDSLDSATQLATTLDALGDHERAERIFREILPKLRTQFGEDDPRTLGARNELVLAIDGQGRFEEAERLGREILNRAVAALGEKHTLTWGIMNNLAIVLGHRGQFEAEEDIFRRLLTAQQEMLGPNHPDTLTAMNNLASAMGSCGKREASEAMYRDVTQRCKTTFGERHPMTLASMNNLAQALAELGRAEEAEQLLRTALEMMQQTLGEDHPQTLDAMSNLGMLLGWQGQLDEATALLSRALELRRARFSDDHPKTLSAMNNMATTFVRLGQLARAEALFRDVIEARMRVLGENHPQTYNALNNLAFVLHEQGKMDEAEAVFRRELALQQKYLGPDHQETLYTLYALGRVLQSKGALDEARAAFQTAAAGGLEDAQAALSKMDSE